MCIFVFEQCVSFPLGFLDGYTFHGDPHKVFEDFFGCNNPFNGLPYITIEPVIAS